MWRLIVRSLFVRKARTIFTIAAIAVGITLMVALVSISEGIKAQTDQAFEGFDVITVAPEQALTGTLPYSYVDSIEDIPGVKVVNPSVTSLPTTINGVDQFEDLGSILNISTIVGYEPDRLAVSSPLDVITGRSLVQGDTHVAVVGRSVADQYDLHLRSLLEVDEVRFSVVGIYETGLSYTEAGIVVPLTVAQEMANLAADEVNAISVSLDNLDEQDTVARRIAFGLEGVRVTTPDEAKAQFGEIESTITKIVWIIPLVVLVVVLLFILNTMMMSVIERRREIGILKAVGWTKGEVLRTFLFEALVIGFLGGVLGILLGWVVVWGIGEIVPQLPAQVTWILVAETMALALGASALAGSWPAWRAARVDPIEALRHD